MLLAFYLWTLIIIGRPQDIFPGVLAPLHPGKIVALLTLLLYTLNIKKKTNIFQTPEAVIFLLFGCLMLASGLCGVYPGQSWRFLTGDFFKLIIYFFILSRILVKPKDIRGLGWVIVLSAVMISLASISIRSQADRISVGTMYDPNDLAMILVIALPFVLYFFLEGGKRVLLAGAGAIILAAFVLTRSRGGFLGLMAVMLAFVFSSRFEKRRGSKVLVIILLALALTGLAGKPYWGRIQTIWSHQDQGSMREVIWARGLKILMENPCLGVGVDCFSTAYGRALEQGKFNKVGNVYDRSWKVAHNSFLQVGTEMGLPGLLVFLLMISLSVKNFREARQVAATQHLAETFRLALIGFLVCAFFLSQAYSVFPYLFLAVSGILRRQVDQVPPIGAI